MSVEAIEEIVARAAEDPEYRRRLGYSPDEALHGYDLTMAERQALVAGDEAKLQQLGVSQRASMLAAQFNDEESHAP